MAWRHHSHDDDDDDNGAEDGLTMQMVITMREEEWKDDETRDGLRLKETRRVETRDGDDDVDLVDCPTQLTLIFILWHLYLSVVSISWQISKLQIWKNTAGKSANVDWDDGDVQGLREVKREEDQGDDNHCDKDDHDDKKQDFYDRIKNIFLIPWRSCS